ncbi:MAG: acyl-CoA thioesterase [Sporichthyaceae bacterium]
MRHRTELQLRWGDMDAYGHVNNVAYAAYTQEARARMFAFHLRDTQARTLLGTLVVAKLRIQWKRQLWARPEPLIATTWISQVRAASLVVECELGDADPADGPYCTASTVLAPYDFAEQRVRRLTEAETEALSEFVEPGVSATA